MPNINDVVGVRVITKDGVYTLPAEGRSYKENLDFLTREERSANGTLRRDITAKKRTFIFDFDPIEGQNLELIDMLLEQYADAPIILEIMRLNASMGDGSASPTQYTTLINPINRERITARGRGLWGGVSLVFSEV